MNKSTILLFSIPTIFFIASCTDSSLSKNANLNSDPNIKIKETIKIDSTTENRYIYLNEVIESNSAFFIKVDFVDYLTGKEAVDAEWRDEAYFVDGTDTMTNITDGFYISNINPKIRTFRVAKDAKIAYVITDDGFHKMEHEKNLNLKQFQQYIDMKTLLFIHIENGIVKRIDERFMS